MTETEIRTALRQLTPAQRRVLVALVQGDNWRTNGLVSLRTMDVLVRRGLVRGLWSDARRLHLVYEPGALVSQVVRLTTPMPLDEETPCA